MGGGGGSSTIVESRKNVWQSYDIETIMLTLLTLSSEASSRIWSCYANCIIIIHFFRNSFLIRSKTQKNCICMTKCRLASLLLTPLFFCNNKSLIIHSSSSDTTFVQERWTRNNQICYKKHDLLKFLINLIYCGTWALRSVFMCVIMTDWVTVRYYVK